MWRQAAAATLKFCTAPTIAETHRTLAGYAGSREQCGEMVASETIGIPETAPRFSRSAPPASGDHPIVGDQRLRLPQRGDARRGGAKAEGPHGPALIC